MYTNTCFHIPSASISCKNGKSPRWWHGLAICGKGWERFVWLSAFWLECVRVQLNSTSSQKPSFLPLLGSFWILLATFHSAALKLTFANVRWGALRCCCRQAKQLHWRFIHDPNRHQEDWEVARRSFFKGPSGISIHFDAFWCIQLPVQLQLQTLLLHQLCGKLWAERWA